MSVDLFSSANLADIDAAVARRQARRRPRFRGTPHRYEITERELGPKDFYDRLVDWCKVSWGWMASLAVHSTAVLILALFTVRSPDYNGPSEWIISPGEAEHDRIVPTIVADVMAVSSASGSSSSVLETMMPVPSGGDIIGNLSPLADRASGEGSGTGGASGPASEAMTMLGESGEGVVEDGEKTGRSQAEFFGIQASGNSFVFVVDSSSSMSGTKWRRCCRELILSIKRLSPEQSYYIFFFDQEIHLMFNQRPDEIALIPATPENLTRLRRWMNSFDLGPSTMPMRAVRYALSMKPDSVFLLSDGEFQDDTATFMRVANLIREGDRVIPETVVHTICFRSPGGAGTLKMIADEHGGTFRFVK